jgi:hypothetical protein
MEDDEGRCKMYDSNDGDDDDEMFWTVDRDPGGGKLAERGGADCALGIWRRTVPRQEFGAMVQKEG